MSLSPAEIAQIEQLVKAGRLKQVSIRQGDENVVIGSEPLVADTPVSAKNAVAVKAPAVGSLSLGTTKVGMRVAKDEPVAILKVLDADLPILAPQPGTVAALLAADGALVGFGTEILLIAPEGAS